MTKLACLTDEELRSLYLKLNKKWFRSRLDKKLKVRFHACGRNTLGCSYWKQSGSAPPAYFEIRITPKLRHPLHGKHVGMTLLHEMAHVAVGAREEHGPVWQDEMQRLIRAGAFDRYLY